MGEISDHYIGKSSVLRAHVLHVQQISPFRNKSATTPTGVDSRDKISHFLTFCNKNYVRSGQNASASFTSSIWDQTSGIRDAARPSIGV